VNKELINLYWTIGDMSVKRQLLMVGESKR